MTKRSFVTKEPIQDGAAVISEVLASASPRPDAKDKDQSKKIQYSVKFADKMAEIIADGLRPKFAGIAATTKRSAASAGGKRKQLDVNFSTPDLGLALGISLKSVHLADV